MIGYNLMQAMRFAVEEINNDSSLLPDVLLGYEMVDVCYVSNNVQPVLYFLAQEDDLLPIQENYSNYVPRVVAVIGPDNSDAVMTVANFLSLFLLPQVRLLGPGEWGRGVAVYRPQRPLLPTIMGGDDRTRSRVRALAQILRRQPCLWSEGSGFGSGQIWLCNLAPSLGHSEAFGKSLNSSRLQLLTCKVG